MKVTIERVSGPVDLGAARLRRLQVATWASILVPLMLFVYLTQQSVAVRRERDQVSVQVRELTQKRQALIDDQGRLREQIASLTRQKQELTADKSHYRTLAGIRVVFYREEDRTVIQSGLATLGLEAELRPNVQTIPQAANTLAFGPDVSVSDCKAVAVALVEAGFPLRRITPAAKIRDARLLQVYASAQTRTSAPVYTADRIQRERVCGAP
jgi:hypothetical protein